MVSGQIHHDSSSSPVRGRQRRSRRSISSSLESPREIGQFSGVVSRPGNSQSALQSVGEPSSGLIRDSRQRESSGLFQPDSGTLGLSWRCPSSRLVKRSAVHVPTNPAVTPGSPQDKERGSGSDRHIAVVAKKRVVPAGPKSTGRSAGASPSSDRHHTQSSRPSSPGAKYPPPSRLATLGETLQAEGVSAAAARTICAGKRQSTRDLYDAKWRNFCGWCAEYGFDPLHPTPQQIVEYLEHLSDVPLSHNTIMTHVSALSSCTYGIEGLRVGIHPLVSAWVRGHKICHPPVKLRVPPWDLPSVLVALGEDKFEPLRQADMEHLTYKTLFLVAVASARRISELHALSVQPPFLIENPLSFNLAVNPAFLPKTNTQEALDSDIELRAFVPNPSSKFERILQRMCPVRALKIYLERTREVRGQNRALFVHFIPAKAPRPISKATLSRFLTAAIREAYFILDREGEIVQANPHTVRGVATTWAEFARVPPKEICRAATWSGPCSFARHYRLELDGDKKDPPNFGTQVLSVATRGRPK